MLGRGEGGCGIGEHLRVTVAVIEYVSLVSGGRDFAVMALSGVRIFMFFFDVNFVFFEHCIIPLHSSVYAQVSID